MQPTHTQINDQIGLVLGLEPSSWSLNRNASYELPVDVEGIWQKAAGDYEMAFFEAFEYYGWHPARLLSAYQECLIWLLYKGWRWADCDSCEGEPHGVSEDCTDCNGEGGEWRKVS